jgi:hypothetical protein
MAKWRITRGEQQFIASDVDELKAWAESGKIRPDDVVLHPDLGRHVYAVELDEIGALLAGDAKAANDEDWEPRKRGVSSAVFNSMVGLSVLVFIAVAVVFISLFLNQPDPMDRTIFDPKQPGTHGSLLAEEALVTEDARLLEEPREGAREIAALPEGRKVVLKAKHGKAWYKVLTAENQEGYVHLDEVIPGYFFDRKERKRLDPIFNPDRYVTLLNYSWEPASAWDRKAPENLTMMGITVENDSPYPMDSIVLEVVLSDMDGQEVDTMNLPVEGEVPANEILMAEFPLEIDYKTVPNARVRVIEARAFIREDTVIPANPNEEAQEPTADEGTEG